MPDLIAPDDLIKQAHRVEMRANALADEIVKTLRRVQGKLASKIAEIEAELLTDHSWNDSNLKTRAAVLKAQAAEIDRVLAEVIPKVREAVESAGDEAIEYMTAGTAKIMVEATGVRVSLTGLSARVVRAWHEVGLVDGLKINEVLDGLEATLRSKFLTVIREAMVEGVGVDTLARRLRDIGVEGTVPQFHAIARTALHSAAGQAEQATYEAFDEVIEGFLYSAVLDGRTCLVCAANDGKVYEKEDPRPLLPRHFNCRCRYLPVTNIEERGKPGARPAVKHAERTVEHRDGSTSTEFKVMEAGRFEGSYSAWLKRQLKEDPDFVRSILGARRFEVYQAGKLNLDRMITDGRIKTLKELGLK